MILGLNSVSDEVRYTEIYLLARNAVNFDFKGVLRGFKVIFGLKGVKPALKSILGSFRGIFEECWL